MNEKEFDKIYEEYMESSGEAPEELKKAYQAMKDALDDYLCAVEKYMFRTGFEFAQNHNKKVV